MRASWKRTALVVALIVAIGLIPFGPAAVAYQEATPAASPVATGDVYADPGGRFTVPIPTNWEAEPQEGYVRLTDPEGLITIDIVALEEPDLEVAIAAAWDLVSPEGEPEATDRREAPTGPGVDRLLLTEYDDGIVSGRLVQAVGQLVGDSSYVLLVEGAREAISRRSSQVQVILTGFQISDVEQVDLGGVTPATLTPEMLAELESFIESTMERFAIPGTSVAIVQDGEVVYRQGFGVRELGGDEPVTPETLMMIGSTTKPMTTMMMASLVDDGILDWNTPVVEILPTFALADPEVTQRITVRDLVCACTGVPRRDLEIAFNSATLDAEHVIASLATFEFFTPIGEAFQYSNQMVAAGGYIATLAAGGDLTELSDDYVSLMQERILGPIEMPNTIFSISDAVATPNHALPHPYELDGTRKTADPEVEAIVTPILPAGGAWSNVDDMARFALTAMNRGVSPDGERVVSEENLAETWQPQVRVGAETSYGLGWLIDEYKGQQVIHHGGNTVGFTSDLAFLPDADIGIVILTNAQGANVFTNAVRVRMLELAFGQEPQIQESVEFALRQLDEEFAETADWVGPAPAEEAVAPYLGDYVNQALGEVTLSYEDGRLLLDAGEFVSEARTTGGELARASDYVLVDGAISGLRFNLGEADGLPALELIDPSGTGTYVLVVPGTGPGATPVASPVASPAAPIASPIP